MAEKQMTGGLLVLQQTAGRLGKPTKACACYDANVCEFSCSAETRWRPVARLGSPFSLQLRTKYQGLPLHLMANADYVRCEVKGSPDLGVCSINRPSRIYPVTRTSLLVGNDRRSPVFVSHPIRDLGTLQSFLNHPEFHETVKQIIRDDLDSLHIFSDCFCLYFKPQSADEVLAAIDLLVGLARLFPALVETIDLKGLPGQFHGLVPLIRKWGVSDDSERSDLLDQASQSDLEQLVNAVNEHFSEINSYLNSFGSESLSEAALALSALGECAAEAVLRLNN